MAKYHGRGTVIHEYKTVKPCKSMCSGCYEDYYNSGASDTGECWSFSSAKVVDKEAYPDIYTNHTKVYKKTLSCYRGVNK